MQLINEEYCGKECQSIIYECHGLSVSQGHFLVTVYNKDLFKITMDFQDVVYEHRLAFGHGSSLQRFTPDCYGGISFHNR